MRHRVCFISHVTSQPRLTVLEQRIHDLLWVRNPRMASLGLCWASHKAVSWRRGILTWRLSWSPVLLQADSGCCWNVFLGDYTTEGVFFSWLSDGGCPPILEATSRSLMLGSPLHGCLWLQASKKTISRQQEDCLYLSKIEPHIRMT